MATTQTDMRTVIVECQYEDGGGESYDVGSAKNGSKELDELIKSASEDAYSTVHELFAEWASVLVGVGTDFDSIDIDTADVVYNVEA